MGAEVADWPVLGLYAGAPAPFGDGTRSAIVKARCRDEMWLSGDGFGIDRQADLTHHGGAERALCHYPADHLPYWRECYPDRAAAFAPGAFGENLCAEGLVESGVSVGDVFRLGEAVIQVTQPRQPCWKVNQRFGVDQLSRRMVDTRRSGWLYRVLEPGRVPPEAEFARIESARQRLTLERLWAVTVASAPEPDELDAAAGHPALARAWRLRLRTRADWLRRRGTRR